jgi:hypothetical protein
MRLFPVVPKCYVVIDGFHLLPIYYKVIIINVPNGGEKLLDKWTARWPYIGHDDVI